MDGTKIFLDIAKESADWFPPLKSALGGVNALIKHYEVFVQRITAVHDRYGWPQEFKDVKEKIKHLKPQLDRLKQNITMTTIDGDPEEEGRRKELTRHARRLLTAQTIVNDLRSALEEIEKRAKELLAKSTAARFIDKGSDSGEVVRLVERLREAITHYQVSENCLIATSMTHKRGQVSQQQAIYDQITNLTVIIFQLVFILHADNLFLHQVFFRYPLETSGGDVFQ